MPQYAVMPPLPLRTTTSNPTTQRRLQAARLFGRQPEKQLLIFGKKLVKLGFDFAKHHLKWVVNSWLKVLWS